MTRIQLELLAFLAYMEASARRQRARKALMEFLDEMQQGNEQVTEQEVEADVLQAIEQVRYGKKK